MAVQNVKELMAYEKAPLNLAVTPELSRNQMGSRSLESERYHLIFAYLVSGTGRFVTCATVLLEAQTRESIHVRKMWFPHVIRVSLFELATVNKCFLWKWLGGFRVTCRPTTPTFIKRY
jgi:hypothetical protein